MKPFIYRIICGGTTGAYLDSPAMNEWQEICLGSFIAAGSPKWAKPWLVKSIEKAGQAQWVAAKTAARVAAKGTTRVVAKKSISRRVATRAIPYIGWGILAYDIGDFLIGDDPSFIGDIIDLF